MKVFWKALASTLCTIAGFAAVIYAYAAEIGLLFAVGFALFLLGAAIESDMNTNNN